MNEVLIVGAGPVGLFLACELRLAGVDVLVLEAGDGSVSELKSMPLGMRGLSIATVESFYRRGLLDRLRSAVGAGSAVVAGLGSDARAGALVASASGGREKRGGHFAGLEIDVSRVDRSSWLIEGPASAPMGASIEQIECVLTERALALGARIQYGCRVSELEQTPSCVRVRVDSLAQGSDPALRDEPNAKSTSLVIEAQWLVGCDGGRSAVRQLAGFDFVGTEATFTTYAALVTLDDPAKLQQGRILTPHGFYMQPLSGFISVMEFDNGAFDRSSGISREHFQTVLRRVSGTDVAVKELKIATSYTDRAKLTTELQRGRVLLAGDSAHIHSPLGGQGLNVGLGDAMNLGWKLARAVQGDPSLLKSYFEERHPVAEWVLDWTRSQVALLRPDPQSRALREVVADMIATRDGATYFAEKLWSVDLRYDLGSTHSLIGRSVPDFVVNGERRIGSYLRNGRGVFVCLDTSSLEELRVSELGLMSHPRIQILNCALETGIGGGESSVRGDERSVCSLKKRFGVRAILVRPDGVICWLVDADGETAPLSSVVEKWFALR